MYLAHFGLKEFPFGLTPDTGYFYAGTTAQGVLNTLLVALNSGEGLIKVVGEVGTGKTMLCRWLLNQLEQESWATAYVPNPNLAPDGLLRTLLTELGGESASEQSGNTTKALEERLLELAQSGLRSVVLIDEAQAMPLASLEALRLVTNLETEKRKLLSIVLFGQPELDTNLAEPSVRQIRSRISFHDRLAPLLSKEVPAYLDHRSRQAGAQHAIFTRQAARKLHRLSRGRPRLLNILAHKALLMAYGEGERQVSMRHVRGAGQDTPEARMNIWDRMLSPRL